MRGLRILMYHVIGERDEPAARFVVPIGAFERQMAWLARLRFNVISLQEAVKRLLANDALPPRAVVLTFDDGTRDLHRLTYPVLERHEFPATAFVVTRAMGSTVTWTERPGIAHRPIVSWDEALALQPLVSLEAHTRTHPSLPKLDDDALAEELRGSRADVEERTGNAARLFAYPFGHYDERVAAAAADAGFVAACSVERGSNDASTSPYGLRRYEIGGGMSLSAFLRTLVT